MKSLNELLTGKLTTRYPELNGNPCSIDILTEEEKNYHLAAAIEHAKKIYVFKLTERGATTSQVIQKVAEKDWNAEINPQEVLQAAANRKYWHEEDQRRQHERLKEEHELRQAIEAEWNADKFLAMITAHYTNKNGAFRSIPGQQRYITALAYFLARDPRFETELGYSLQRGLMIMGDPGLGKTETLKAVSSNQRTPLAIVSMIEIADHVKSEGSCELNLRRTIVIDDVGTEPVPVKYYGTEINWFKEFIETVYLRQPSYENLIITTNLGGDRIQELYSYRVRSRLRDMFNVISVTGEDQRK